MAAAFKNQVVAGVGNTDQTIHTAQASVNTTLIGMTIANVTANQIKASVKVTSGATTAYIIKDAPIPVGGTLVPIGGEQKVVLEAADVIEVVTDTAAAADVILSYLES
jgi:hypothetical protein